MGYLNFSLTHDPLPLLFMAFIEVKHPIHSKASHSLSITLEDSQGVSLLLDIEGIICLHGLLLSLSLSLSLTLEGIFFAFTQPPPFLCLDQGPTILWSFWSQSTTETTIRASACSLVLVHN